MCSQFQHFSDIISSITTNFNILNLAMANDFSIYYSDTVVLIWNINPSSH